MTFLPAPKMISFRRLSHILIGRSSLSYLESCCAYIDRDSFIKSRCVGFLTSSKFHDFSIFFRAGPFFLLSSYLVVRCRARSIIKSIIISDEKNIEIKTPQDMMCGLMSLHGKIFVTVATRMSPSWVRCRRRDANWVFAWSNHLHKITFSRETS